VIERDSPATRASGSAGSDDSVVGRIERSVGRQMVASSPDSRKRSTDSASRPSASLNSAMPIPPAPPAAKALRSSSNERLSVEKPETEKRGST
jgi:hypothetical protein